MWSSLFSKLGEFLRMLAGGARTYETVKDLDFKNPGKAADSLERAADAADKLGQSKPQ